MANLSDLVGFALNFFTNSNFQADRLLWCYCWIGVSSSRLLQRNLHKACEVVNMKCQSTRDDFFFRRFQRQHKRCVIKKSPLLEKLFWREKTRAGLCVTSATDYLWKCYLNALCSTWKRILQEHLHWIEEQFGKISWYNWVWWATWPMLDQYSYPLFIRLCSANSNCQ